MWYLNPLSCPGWPGAWQGQGFTFICWKTWPPPNLIKSERIDHPTVILFLTTFYTLLSKGSEKQYLLTKLSVVISVDTRFGGQWLNGNGLNNSMSPTPSPDINRTYDTEDTIWFFQPVRRYEPAHSGPEITTHPWQPKVWQVTVW